MKVLVVADVEDKMLYDFFRKDRVEGVELIVSCGDLKASYLDFLMTMVNVPMIYIRGNHDDSFASNPPLGAECIEDRVFKYKGVRFVGLGGCVGSKPGALNMYTEGAMKRRIIKLLPRLAITRGFDVLVTHAPAKGYGDMEGSHTHMGFECFNKFMNKYHPKYMFHGHVHNNYGNVKMVNEHPSGTQIINACGYRIVDIPVPGEE